MKHKALNDPSTKYQRQYIIASLQELQTNEAKYTNQLILSI